MKKCLALVSLALAMTISLAGCSTNTTEETSQSSNVTGTFTGTSTGMQGPVTVEMSVENGKITKVEVTESSETAGLADVALERIPAQIVEHQTTKLDTVTGATLASNAIMRAASAAAEEAGLDMDVLNANEYHAQPGEDETWNSDVVVVGGGGAGFAAAISAAQEGSQVILIEKSSFLGGNTMMAGGAYNAVDTEAQAEVILTEAQKNTLDSYLALSATDENLHLDQFPEWVEVLTQLQQDITDFYAANVGKTAGVDMPGFDSISLHMWHIYVGGLRQMNDGDWIASDIDLARTLAENALNSYDWAGSLGVGIASHEGAGETLGTVLGAMWPRTHRYTAGVPLMEVLEKAAEDEGVKIYTETAAEKLLTDENGKVIGLEAKKADGTKVTINTTTGVILASGGYCANPAMVKEYDEYWGDDLSDHTLTTNVGTNTGDGIVMAMEVGADTVDLGVAQMMPSSSPIKGTMTDGVWADASEQIWIDGNAKRFVNEYAERDVLAKASLELDNGIFYIIYAGSGSQEADATEETSQSSNVTGTFTGTSTGMQGPVTVEMSVENGKITKVAVTECSETAGLADVALERIPAQIVEHQTTKLDTVTGATLASNAIMRAASAAAEEAGLDMELLNANEYHAQPGEDETWNSDVVVVGGGGAGFAAAISAAQEGSQVILIEKSSFLGGNTMMAGGAYNAVDTEAQAEVILTEAQKNTLDSYLALSATDENLHLDQFPEWVEVLTQLQQDITDFYAANVGKTAGVDMPGFDSISLHMWHIYVGGLRQMNDGDWIASDIDLARTLAENALNSYDWAGSLGVGIASHEGAGETLGTVLGAMWPRTHHYTAGVPLMEVLEKAAEAEGVKIYTETAAEKLLTDENGKVIGLEAKKADGTKVTINTTTGVILASGGYCANPAMVKEYDEYWGDDLSDHTLTTNVGTNTGDGIVMAGVILASGGYCANPAMVKEYDEYWGDDLSDHTLTTNVGTNTGDGIVMAMEVGADTVDLGVAQMMPSSSPIKGTMTDGVWADASQQIWIDGNAKRFVNEYAERDVLAKASLELDNGIFYIIYAGSGSQEADEQIWIDGNAKRFVNEYAERDVLAKASLELDNGIFYIIYAGSGSQEADGKCKGASLEQPMFGTTIQSMVDNGHVWYGSTLAELAEATKESAGGAAPAFSEEALREVIETYNSYVENQNDPDFGKEVLAGAIDLEAIENNPDAGIVISPRKASLHHTMGGVVINTDAEVLNTEGNVIEGLWAAGEVTGGVHAGNRLGGNAIADIFTFGQIAGKSAGAAKK